MNIMFQVKAIILLASIFPVSCFAQRKPGPSPVQAQTQSPRPQANSEKWVEQLPELMELEGPFPPLKLMNFALSWEILALEDMPSGLVGRSTSEATQDLGGWLSKHALTNDFGERTLVDLVVKNRDDLVNALNSIKYIGDDKTVLLYETGSIPFTFARKDTSLAFVLQAVSSGSVYNTLRTTDKSAAAKVFSSTVLPVVREFSRAMSSAGIKLFVVQVCYGSRDFSKDDHPQGEILIAVVPADKARQFTQARLTAEEVLAGSDVYLRTHAAQALEKVRLSLE